MNPFKYGCTVNGDFFCPRPALEREMQELNDFARKFEGDDFEIKPWDYSYYANLLKNKKFNLGVH